MSDAVPLSLVVKLVRERGASFAEAYLMRQWGLSMTDAADLVTQAQRTRYSRTLGAYALSKEGK